MPYSFDSIVRFSETGEDEKLSLPGILDYFQDCCTLQAASIHQGLHDIARRGRGWVLSAMQVIINRYPAEGEPIRVTTYPYKLQGYLGYRNFSLDAQDGTFLAVANSWWTYLDIKNGQPARLTASPEVFTSSSQS